jgi:hypothetical protein
MLLPGHLEQVARVQQALVLQRQQNPPGVRAATDPVNVDSALHGLRVRTFLELPCPHITSARGAHDIIGKVSDTGL